MGSLPLLQAAFAQKESNAEENEVEGPLVLGTTGALSVPDVKSELAPNRWTVKTPPVTSRPAPLVAPVSRSTTVSVVKGVELSEPIGLALHPAEQVLVTPHGFARGLAST